METSPSTSKKSVIGCLSSDSYIQEWKIDGLKSLAVKGYAQIFDLDYAELQTLSLYGKMTFMFGFLSMATMQAKLATLSAGH